MLLQWPVDGASVMKEKSDCMAFPDLKSVGITKDMLKRAAKYVEPDENDL